MLAYSFWKLEVAFSSAWHGIVVSREKVAEIERKAPLHLYFPTVSYRPLQFAS